MNAAAPYSKAIAAFLGANVGSYLGTIVCYLAHIDPSNTVLYGAVSGLVGAAVTALGVYFAPTNTTPPAK